MYIDESRIRDFLPSGDAEKAREAHRVLTERTGAGREFLGWLDLPVKSDRQELSKVKETAEKIAEDSGALVVIGIGGSCLGARAVIEFLRPSEGKDGRPEVYFAGDSLSGDSVSRVLELVGDRDVSVNVVSKSGTTTEPAVAFRIFKELLSRRYGSRARERIYVTTDREKGALRQMAEKEGYETFTIPEDVGGRYSVLTPAGLLPIAVSGVSPDALLEGARAQREACLVPDGNNAALRYAMDRRGLFARGKTTEILACYEPGFRTVAEWWKQLFGESEGKNGGGIFPAFASLTADLHSMGQYIQEGMRNLQETVVLFDKPRREVRVPYAEGDPEGLNYLAGRSLHEINRKAAEATARAHKDGGVPVTMLHFDRIDPYACGELLYFFEFACGISAYMAGVNPFDQPGVETYKRNMFRLLGKPGFEGA